MPFWVCEPVGVDDSVKGKVMMLCGQLDISVRVPQAVGRNGLSVSVDCLDGVGIPRLPHGPR